VRREENRARVKRRSSLREWVARGGGTTSKKPANLVSHAKLKINDTNRKTDYHPPDLPQPGNNLHGGVRDCRGKRAAIRQVMELSLILIGWAGLIVMAFPGHYHGDQRVVADLWLSGGFAPCPSGRPS